MISGRCLPICCPSLQCDIKRVWSILFGGFLFSVVYILYNIYLIISGAMNLRITRTTSFGSITQGLKNQERIALACIFHGSKKVPAPWRVFWLQEEHDYTFSILSPQLTSDGRRSHNSLWIGWAMTQEWCTHVISSQNIGDLGAGPKAKWTFRRNLDLGVGQTPKIHRLHMIT